jgi:two-component system, OmpR family, sensor kinase
MRSLRNKLALLFFAIVLGAILVIYSYVVPQLESRLRNEKVRALEQDTRTYARPIVEAIRRQVPAKRIDQAVRDANDRANARVTLMLVARGTAGLRPTAISDSTNAVELNGLFEEVATDALRRRGTATGFESSDDGRLAEAARPLRFAGKLSHVLVFSAPLSDVQANVALIRRQILIAGAIALLVAVLAGYLVARALSLRVKRLEEAAEKVAGGDFSQPILVDSLDELGQLAIAFNEMQRQLARLDSARKRFIATASHELRTPIFSLGGFLELLEDEDLDASTRAQFLSEIRAQIDRLTNLATELLDLSRLEAGSLELRPEPVDLAELTRSVAGEFAPALSQHRSRLNMRLPDDELEATCDAERVAQIVRILIDNAIAHTPAGTDIVVSAERADGVVRLAVRDAGPGIRRDVLPHVFEAFYTADDGQGSGLGLAIARELAERMSGRLAARSRPGSTAFTLELPIPDVRDVSTQRSLSL